MVIRHNLYELLLPMGSVALNLEEVVCILGSDCVSTTAATRILIVYNLLRL